MKPVPFKRSSCLTILFLILVCSGCDMPGGNTTSNPTSYANGQAILAWGGNSSGQLGDGTNAQRLNPALLSLTDIRAIAAGGNFTLALTADGRVLEWGGNRTTPTEISGLTSVRQIAVGERHRLALKNDGTVWAWGENDHGQLGDGTTLPRPSPVQVVGLTGILTIAAGGQHSLAVKGDLTMVTWGANGYGQLGDNSTTDRLTPVVVPGVTAIEAAASAVHTVVLTTDLRVMGWGGNSECQLGIDPRSDPFDPIVCSDHLQPILILNSQNPMPRGQGGAIAANNYMTLIVLSDGSVYALGGARDTTQFRGICNSDVVTGIAALQQLPDVEEVTAGGTHALFRTASGEVWSLGANLAGQAGLGTTSVMECAQGIAVSRVRGATDIAAGGEHSLALMKGVVTLSPTLLNFGNQAVGTSSAPAREVSITNSGLVPITFSDITSEGADFTLTENCPDNPSVLAAGVTCTVSVTFTPTTSGQRSGRLLITDNGIGGQQELALSGTGTESHVVLSPTTVSFGNQAVGTPSVSQTVTLQNDGTAELLITDITATTGFSVASDTCPRSPASLPVQATCTVEVVFSPLATGDTVGDLRVAYEINKSTSMRLEGRGV